MGGSVRVVVVSSQQDFYNLLDNVRGFFELVIDEYHQHPEVLLAKPRSSNQAVILMFALIGENIVGYMPFLEREIKIHLKFSIFKFFGIRQSQLQFIGSKIVLVPNYDAEQITTAFIDRIEKMSGSLDNVNFSGLRNSFDFLNIIVSRQFFDVYFAPEGNNLTRIINIHRDFSDYLSSFSSKQRREIKREVRRMNKSVDGVKLKCYKKVEDVTDFCKQTSAIYKSSWKEGDSSLVSYQVYDEHIRPLAKKENWLGYILFGDGKALAFFSGIVFHKIYYLQHTCYLNEYRELTPGKVLATKMIEDIHINQSCRFVDFGYGESYYKKTYSNTMVEAKRFVLLISGEAKIMYKMQLLLDLMYSQILKILVKVKIDAPVRQILKN